MERWIFKVFEDGGWYLFNGKIVDNYYIGGFIIYDL